MGHGHGGGHGGGGRAVVAQTEAQTMIGLTQKIRTVTPMMQTKKTKNANEKKTKMMNN